MKEGGVKASVNGVRALLGDQAAAAPKKKKKAKATPKTDKTPTASTKAPAKKAAAE